MARFFEELKRRNVFKVGGAYVVMAWLIAQGVDVFLENFGTPDWVIKTILFLLVAGLPIALFFAWAFELTPEGIKKEKDVERSQSITHRTGRKLDFMIIAVLIVALGYFVVDKFVLNQESQIVVSETDTTDATANSEAAESQAEAVTDKSIAVLPFVNMSDDASNEYFSDGISEEILNALAKVKELQVAGRTSSFAFKGENQDLRKIGEALNVGHILEGSVRKAGGKVRITAQLIRVDTGYHVWSESYDRELDDVFAIQDEIATAILHELKAALLGGETEVVASARTNPEAYDLYLLAKQRMYERSQLPLESAAKMLDKAIALDSEYAPAYAQRGITTLLLSDRSYGDIPNEQAGTQAKLYLDQALKLDPNLAEAWAGIGLYHSFRPAEAQEQIEALEKALSLNANMVNAANWLNNAYNSTNQPAKALAILEKLSQRDPLYKPGLGNLTIQYLQMGQPDKAKALIEKVRPFIPNDANIHWLDGQILQSQGDIASSLAYYQKALELNPNDRVYRISTGFSQLRTHQYEKAAENGYRFVKVIALRRLGRTEEASILAREYGNQGSIQTWFEQLNRSGQSAKLIAYLEEAWSDLEAFEKEFPSNGYFGYLEMVEIALAYKRAGRQEKFDEAMSRLRAAHDSLITQGLHNIDFFLLEAAYFAMKNDQTEAKRFLAAAIDGGEILSTRISDEMPFFIEFEGDPEYEAIQTRMLEHLNREREQLGLEPVST